MFKKIKNIIFDKIGRQMGRLYIKIIHSDSINDKDLYMSLQESCLKKKEMLNDIKLADKYIKGTQFKGFFGNLKKKRIVENLRKAKKLYDGDIGLPFK